MTWSRIYYLDQNKHGAKGDGRVFGATEKSSSRWRQAK